MTLNVTHGFKVIIFRQISYLQSNVQNKISQIIQIIISVRPCVKYHCILDCCMACTVSSRTGWGIPICFKRVGKCVLCSMSENKLSH